jgi:hypothetical protein
MKSDRIIFTLKWRISYDGPNNTHLLPRDAVHVCVSLPPGEILCLSEVAGFVSHFHRSYVHRMFTLLKKAMLESSSVVTGYHVHCNALNVRFFFSFMLFYFFSLNSNKRLLWKKCERLIQVMVTYWCRIKT